MVTERNVILMVTDVKHVLVCTASARWQECWHEISPAGAAAEAAAAAA